MDAPPVRLSIAILSRNCAPQIRATIDSIRHIAEEVVVLDTGSSDDTLTIALQAGALVHRHPWTDDFAAARNAALGKLTGDWVLWLDAGETLLGDTARLLRQFIDREAQPRWAYFLPVVLPATAGHVGGEQIARIRLHPRRGELRFAGRVRESLDQSLSALSMSVEHVQLPICRGPQEHDLEIKANRARRNIRLADLQIAEHGVSAELQNCLGEAFQALGGARQAGQHYRRALDLSLSGSREQLEAYYGLLTCVEGLTGDREAQLALCMEALEQFPLDAHLLVALGGYLQAQEQIELAVRAYDVAFRHGQTEPRIWHLPEIREIAASCAATALLAAGREEETRSLLEAAQRTCPESRRLARQLLDLHLRHGRRDEALAVVASLAEPGREALSHAVRGACLAGQLQWPAALEQLQAALAAGCRERFCFRWLVVTWLGLGQPSEAQSVLRAWQAVDAANPELAGLTTAIAEQLAAGGDGEGQILRVDGADTRLGSRAPSPVVRLGMAGQFQP
ncbi:MAG: glycosyltransferase [Pirellulaceae bacterium]|nr:glycosyltransferase [Pirellulaceae bacterium]